MQGLKTTKEFMIAVDFLHICNWSLRRKGEKEGNEREKKWSTVFKFNEKTLIYVTKKLK